MQSSYANNPHTATKVQASLRDRSSSRDGGRGLRDRIEELAAHEASLDELGIWEPEVRLVQRT